MYHLLITTITLRPDGQSSVATTTVGPYFERTAKELAGRLTIPTSGFDRLPNNVSVHRTVELLPSPNN